MMLRAAFSAVLALAAPSVRAACSVGALVPGSEYRVVRQERGVYAAVRIPVRLSYDCDAGRGPYRVRASLGSFAAYSYQLQENGYPVYRSQGASFTIEADEPDPRLAGSNSWSMDFESNRPDFFLHAYMTGPGTSREGLARFVEALSWSAVE